MTRAGKNRSGFDHANSVTRSLLAWGGVAGPFYLIFGVILGMATPGFAFSRHELGSLMLGSTGWLQRVNIIISGVMVLAGAMGYGRAMAGSRWSTPSGALLGAFGLTLIIRGIVAPDPGSGFPAESAGSGLSAHGATYIVVTGLSAMMLGSVAIIVGQWFADRGAPVTMRWFTGVGVLVVLGTAGRFIFFGTIGGIAMGWLVSLVGYLWLLYASVKLYRIVPRYVNGN